MDTGTGSPDTGSPDTEQHGGRWTSAVVARWEARGTYRRLRGHRIFTVDVPPQRDAGLDPILVLHGFPTCSFDFHLVVDRLARTRRVLLLDFLGYGLSAKPDLAYHVELQADIVEAFVADATATADSGPRGHASRSSTRLALLTHDMGDTVGGELLARQSSGTWPVQLSRRVVTNGSVYLEMAKLTQGQQMLLSLPDERLETPLDPTGTALVSALRATFSPRAAVASDELDAARELISHGQGDLLLPRLVRYIEDRRRNESRYTGAIESHPSPLAVVWGTDDPIAVAGMASRLRSVRPDAPLVFLDGVGHYPMLEQPALFADAIEVALGS